MNRRDLLKGFVAATATVAIGLRLASKLPTVDLKDAIDTWRWELATDNYFYGLDTLKPWQVEIYNRLDGDDWEVMQPQDLLAMAEDSIQVTEAEVQMGPFPSNPDQDSRMFVCGKDERWPWNNTEYVTRETVEEYGLDPESEEMEAAAVIAMSQGFAALQVEGGPHIVNGDYGFGSGIDTHSPFYDSDVIRVPRIHETKEALFRHG